MYILIIFRVIVLDKVTDFCLFLSKLVCTAAVCKYSGVMVFKLALCPQTYSKARYMPICYSENVNSISKKQVDAAAKKYIKPDSFNSVIVGPDYQ